MTHSSASSWLRWSLRQQLILVGVVCGLAAIVGAFVRVQYLRSEFRRLGGETLVVGERPIGGMRQFGVAFSGANFDSVSLNRAMDIADALGLEHHTVSFSGTRIDDLNALSRWDDIRVIVVEGTDFTPSHIDLLAKIPTLEYLVVNEKVVLDRLEK